MAFNFFVASITLARKYMTNIEKIQFFFGGGVMLIRGQYLSILGMFMYI
jgi:hypothetical protein